MSVYVVTEIGSSIPVAVFSCWGSALECVRNEAIERTGDEDNFTEEQLNDMEYMCAVSGYEVYDMEVY